MKVLDFFSRGPKLPLFNAARGKFEDGRAVISKQFLLEYQANPPAAIESDAAVGVHYRKAIECFDAAATNLRKAKTEDAILANILQRATVGIPSPEVKEIAADMERVLDRLDTLTRRCRPNLEKSITFQLDWDKKGRDWTTYLPGAMLSEFKTAEILRLADNGAEIMRKLQVQITELDILDRAAAKKRSA